LVWRAVVRTERRNATTGGSSGSAVKLTLQVSDDEGAPDSSAACTPDKGGGTESKALLSCEEWAALSSPELIGSANLRQLRREAYRHTRDYQDAADVVSDALVKTAEWLLKEKHRDKPVPVVRAYLWKAVKTTAVDRRRHRAVVDRIFPPRDGLEGPEDCDSSHEPGVIPQDSVRFQAESRMLQQLLNALPEKSRRVLLLRVVWSFSGREIAELCGISTRTVEKHLELAWRAIRQRIPATGGSDGAR
jgi:RNA polymerase sigma factor (sigma-70 family)